MNWFTVAQHTFKTVMDEMETVSTESLPQMFPKFVVMYEYFRLLRGEAFLNHRGPVTSDEQRRLYDMQDEIGKKLLALKSRLDSDDGSAKYYMEEMKKQFDI
jgi:hypothetical protein